MPNSRCIHSVQAHWTCASETYSSGTAGRGGVGGAAGAGASGGGGADKDFEMVLKKAMIEEAEIAKAEGTYDGAYWDQYLYESEVD